MERRGILIVNEGPDGSGKETQTTLLCRRLEREGIPVVRFDFPTYGADPVADLIRTMLKTMKGEWNHRPWQSKAVLFASNRLRFLEPMQTALATGGAVVCNRYTPTNQAHMAGYVEEVEEWGRRFAWVAHLEYDMMGLLRPDIVLLHTMPRSTRDKLLHVREKGQRDAHEENSPYLERVVHCFHALARREPDVWRHIPADVDGRVESPEDVHARVWDALVAHPAWQAFVQEHTLAPERV